MTVPSEGSRRQVDFMDEVPKLRDPVGPEVEEGAIRSQTSYQAKRGEAVQSQLFQRNAARFYGASADIDCGKSISS